MKIKLDENMPAAMAHLLREAGYDAHTICDEGLGGAHDTEVISAATAEGRILFTFDIGFGNVHVFPYGSHAGVVVFRLRDQRWAVLEEPVRRVLASGTLERLAGRLAVVDDTRIRMARR